MSFNPQGVEHKRHAAIGAGYHWEYMELTFTTPTLTATATGDELSDIIWANPADHTEAFAIDFSQYEVFAANFNQAFAYSATDGASASASLRVGFVDESGALIHTISLRDMTEISPSGYASQISGGAPAAVNGICLLLRVNIGAATAFSCSVDIPSPLYFEMGGTT